MPKNVNSSLRHQGQRLLQMGIVFILYSSLEGFVIPHFVIDETKRQEGRDLTRFDVEYDIPDHFLPEFPPAITCCSPSPTLELALLPKTWRR